jgi:hypothetical protein
MLTTRLHLVPRLSMGGAIPLLPLHASMAWTGKTLPLSSYSAFYICFEVSSAVEIRASFRNAGIHRPG